MLLPLDADVGDKCEKLSHHQLLAYSQAEKGINSISASEILVFLHPSLLPL